MVEFQGSVTGPWADYIEDADSRGIGTLRLSRRLLNPEASRTEFANRTLTNLYNSPPTWLLQAHENLDRAVSDAYGWAYDLADDDLLANILALNLQRADS